MTLSRLVLEVVGLCFLATKSGMKGMVQSDSKANRHFFSYHFHSREIELYHYHSNLAEASSRKLYSFCIQNK